MTTRGWTPRQVTLAFFILAYVLGIQLVGIQRPFLGHYASYQGTVMASIARNMVRENFSGIFLPKTDTILEGQRSLHLNQYPLPSLLTALGVRFIGGTYEFWGRFQAVVFNLFSVLLVFGIARRFWGETAAWVSATVFALSPLAIVYGQSFTSEASSLFFFLCSFYLLVRHDPCSLGRLLLSAVSFSLAVTGRLHWILFLPTFCILTWWGSEARYRFRNILLFCIFTLILPFAWYAHTYFASLHAANVHTNLFLQMATSKKAGSFWLHGDLYRAMGIVFGRGMFALVMAPFFVLGIPCAFHTRVGRLCFFTIVMVTLALMVLSPEKLIRHDFYMYAISPFAAFIAALGAEKFLGYYSKNAAFMAAGLFLLLLACSAFFSFRPVFHVPENEKRVLAIAERVREKTLPEDKLIVGGEGTGVFVFYVDRPAWVLTPSAVGKKLDPYLRMTRFTGRDAASIEKLEKAQRDPSVWLEYLRRQGAEYFVAVEPRDFQGFPGFLRHLSENYQNLSRDLKHYLFYRLEPVPAGKTTSLAA